MTNTNSVTREMNGLFQNLRHNPKIVHRIFFLRKAIFKAKVLKILCNQMNDSVEYPREEIYDAQEDPDQLVVMTIWPKFSQPKEDNYSPSVQADNDKEAPNFVTFNGGEEDEGYISGADPKSEKQLDRKIPNMYPDLKRINEQLKNIKTNVTLDNSDIIITSNGKEGYPIQECSLFGGLVKRRINNSYENILWVPFASSCLLHPKLCHELGQTKNNENFEDL